MDCLEHDATVIDTTGLPHRSNSRLNLSTRADAPRVLTIDPALQNLGIGRKDFVAMSEEIEAEIAIFEAGVGLAAAVVPSCEAASVFVLEAGRHIGAPASTSEMASAVDDLQLEHGEGPCISAMDNSGVVSCPDLETETRWPAWATDATRKTEVRSMLCFGLSADGRQLGALNLFATRPHAFGTADVEAGQVVAEFVSQAALDAQKLHHTHIAMNSRSLIGQAQGLLMERFNLDGDAAFSVLKRISQDSNRKLRDLAEEVVRTRELPTQ